MNTTQPQLRKEIRQQRKNLTAKQRTHSALRASLHLPKLLPHLPKHAHIGLYLDNFGELPTLPILQFCQKHNFVPCLPITQADRPLIFAPVYGNLTKTPLRRHAFGMQEPFSKYTLTADKLDMIICPLIAVDRQGNRMGMGGGFYDRTFAIACNTYKVGWCYHFQLVENLTTNAWDKKIDMAITDKVVLWF